MILRKDKVVDDLVILHLVRESMARKARMQEKERKTESTKEWWRMQIRRIKERLLSQWDSADRQKR